MSTSLAASLPDNEQRRPDTVQEGALLLSLGRGVLFSLNESALIVWLGLETAPDGLSPLQMVDILSRYYEGSGVAREQLERDVQTLMALLVQRGFLTCDGARLDPERLRIEEDVLRDIREEVVSSELRETFDSELSYLPMATIPSTLIRTAADTLLGLLAIVLYELVLKLTNFRKMYAIVDQWPVASSRQWTSARVRQVCAGVDRARRWYPKKLLCLHHSAVVTCLLRRIGAPAQMVFGACRFPFYAHAWCEVEGTVVNDEQNVRTRFHIFRQSLSRKHRSLERKADLVRMESQG